MFKNPFSFEGRIRRTEYGITFIIYVIASLIINLVIDADEGTAILGLAYIPILWLLFAQGAKRCHDRGHSGWYQLIPLYVLWMLLDAGDSELNEYGPNPKGV